MSDTFDPAQHLTPARKNGPADYLQVKWRLVWLRADHPKAAIVTEKVAGGVKEGFAEFRAVVSIPDGGSASGYGSETSGDFGDFIEKAETKAIGRALACLGFGTQFVGEDMDDAPRAFGGDERPNNPRIVDSPTPRRTTQQQPAQAARVAPTPANAAQQAAADQGNQRATERQVKFAIAIGREAGLDDAELDGWCQELYGQSVDQLNRRDCSTLIEALQRRRNEVA